MYVSNNALLGDALIGTPALRAFKKKFPKEKLHYFHSPNRPAHQLLVGNPYIDQLTVTDTPGEYVNGEDPIIDYDAWHAHTLALSLRCSMTEAYGLMLGLSLADMTDLRYDYVMTDEELQGGKARIQGLTPVGSKGVILCARHSASCSSNDPRCGGRANKCLPNRMWVAFAKWIERQGYTPVAVGAPSDLDDSRFYEWPGQRLYNLSLRELAAVVAASHAVITIDTGLRHLAAAVHTNYYCLSGAVTLSHLSCHPQSSEHRIVEEFVPLHLASPQHLVKGAQKVL